ncbi:MAG: endonuclease dU, partial [Promethearchaeota archaeon]
KFNSESHSTDLIGIVCQGTRMVSMVKKEITIDGDDATEVLIELIRQNEKHVQYVITDTITFGGFNIIDLEEIHSATNKPIIAVTEKEVDLNAVKKAILKTFPQNNRAKLRKIVNAGNLYETVTETAGGLSKVYFHSKGISFTDVEALFQKVCIDSKIPEPVRLAHIIGKAL